MRNEDETKDFFEYLALEFMCLTKETFSRPFSLSS
jgi:hypothetical protein